MNFEIIRPEPKPQSATRFAFGRDTGTLYFLPDVTSLQGVVIIGAGSMFGQEGQWQKIKVEELLPPGTTIKITT